MRDRLSAAFATELSDNDKNRARDCGRGRKNSSNIKLTKAPLFLAPLDKLVERNIEYVGKPAQRVNIGRAVSVFVIANQALFAAQFFGKLALRQTELRTVIFDICGDIGFHNCN